MIIKILLILFLVAMIPNIFVYGYHGHHEFEEAFEHIGIPETDHKGNEQFAEGIFFSIVTVGYIITTIFVLVKPYNTISYYAILVGTVIIIIIYYASKTSGLPAPDFYDNWIIDDSTNWKDNVTKIAQQAMVIPLSMLLILRATKIKCLDRE